MSKAAHECTLLSEAALSDWLRPEEDVWDAFFAAQADEIVEMADRALADYKAGRTWRLPSDLPAWLQPWLFGWRS